MTVHHLLSISDLTASQQMYLVDRALAIKAGRVDSPLRGRTVGIYFRKTSTRTRTSFTVGALKLGASIIAYGPDDLQIQTGETLEDTARVLASYLDAFVVRTAANIDEMKKLAQQSSMPVINAMSEYEHPTQAISDLSTINEHFGHLDGIHVLYVGEGNNTAVALALAMALAPGMKLSLFTPRGYGIPAEFLAQARSYCSHSGSMITEFHDPESLPCNVDVVYTTRWITTGSTKPDPNWREQFRDFRVDAAFMGRVGRTTGTVFMHDLPAVREEDSTSEVLDGPQSIAFVQAANKLYSAMAVLEWCVIGSAEAQSHSEAQAVPAPRRARIYA
jgi:ornithine carbamoyltransferase